MESVVFNLQIRVTVGVVEEPREPYQTLTPGLLEATTVTEARLEWQKCATFVVMHNVQISGSLASFAGS